MSTYTVTKINSRKWAVTDEAGTEVGTFPTKRAAEQHVETLGNEPRVERNAVKGWDLIVNGDVVATFTRKAEAVRELKAALADAEAVEAEDATPEPEPQPEVDPSTLDRAARLVAAKAEQAAVKAWEDGGRKGPAPATPVLDLMRAGGKAPKAAKPKGERKTGGASRLRVADEDRPAVLAEIVRMRREGLSWAKIGVAFQELPYRTTTGEPIPESNLYLLAKHAPEGDLRNVKAAEESK